MERSTPVRKHYLLLLPPMLLVVALILSAGILNAARRSTDMANAHMLYIVGVLASLDDGSRNSIEPYLPSMPVPEAVGSLREFAVFDSGDTVLVYALEDETTGFRFDPGTNSFDSSPTSVVGIGTRIPDPRGVT